MPINSICTPAQFDRLFDAIEAFPWGMDRHAFELEMPKRPFPVLNDAVISNYVIEHAERVACNQWNEDLNKEMTITPALLVSRVLWALREVLPGVRTLRKAGLTASNKKPPVSIIIPAWNQWAYTKMTLATIYGRTAYPDFEVIVVDNGSRDETATHLPILAQKLKRLKVITLDDNIGFSGANNLGVRDARGELLLFLNNDIEIERSDWLDKLVASLLSHPRIGAVGQNGVYDLGDASRDRFIQALCFDSLTIPVSWISGYCLLMRRDVFAQAGPWRSDLYGKAGWEDIHMGYAIRKAGWLNVAPPEFVGLHHLIGKTQTTPAARAAKSAEKIDKRKIFTDHFGPRIPIQNLVEF